MRKKKTKKKQQQQQQKKKKQEKVGQVPIVMGHLTHNLNQRFAEVSIYANHAII